MKSKLKHLLLAALYVLALGACAIANPRPPTSYYIITATPVAGVTEPEPSAQGAPVLEIAALSLPQYLERQQIVSRPTAHRLVIHEYDRWGDNLGNNLKRVLARNLSLRLNSPNVVVAPHMLTEIDYRLLVNIQHFERVEDDHVLLRAQWTLLKPGEDKPLAVRTANITRYMAADADIDRVVSLMSETFAELADQIVAATRQ